MNYALKHIDPTKLDASYIKLLKKYKFIILEYDKFIFDMRNNNAK